MSGAERLPLPQLIEEAQRLLSICNACRYCEGYCAVFPALQRRLAFPEQDVHYLANLCHNCGACHYACQYAPPHPFDLNFPRTLARVRERTYRRYAWPGAFASLYDRNALAVAMASAFGIAFMFLLAAWLTAPAKLFQAHPDAAGAFHALIPHGPMVAVFGAVSLFVALAFAIGIARFWPDMGESLADLVKPRPAAEALHDAFTLRWLDGGEDRQGCRHPDEPPSNARRVYHHLTFYGFLLCFAATTTATVYHYGLGLKAPYPFLSLPVILGTVGGLGLIAGPLGLLALRRRRDPELAAPEQKGMDEGFLALLIAISVTGLALTGLRETAAMGVLLCLHLGAVLALFLTMPYGKFAHAIYRVTALARFHLERRRPVAFSVAD